METITLSKEEVDTLKDLITRVTGEEEFHISELSEEAQAHIHRIDAFLNTVKPRTRLHIHEMVG